MKFDNPDFDDTQTDYTLEPLTPLEVISDEPPLKPRSSRLTLPKEAKYVGPAEEDELADREESAEPEEPAVGFTDNFLQDRNIKWILGVGTAILLGSSLMLVSSQWAGYSAIFKELIILAYTGLVFLVGRYSYERLALRRTGTVLLTLSVMLAPVACAALPMVRQVDTWNVAYLGLLAVAGALTWRIGSRAFKHFLRDPEPSFTISYVVLALAAGIIPLAGDDVTFLRSPLMALGLWLVFAAGTIKVNRRVFHLLEEQRRPRIFGFFPMLLLALQYLGLFVPFFAGQTPIEWLGFGCVLTAIPMLLAADAVADVFRQRTGNLVRPLPWSIMLPLITGLMLCATGVALAAAPFNTRPLFALVPTALLAAAVLARVAQRTERQTFVYGALVLIAAAYRFAPVYFAAAAKAFINSAATAIHEPKLPIAYFGFTFVPLLALFTFASLRADKRGSKLFAEPTRRFALFLGLLFLVLAPTHAKAMFPASATLLAVFAAQTMLFRKRFYVLPALAAAMLAAAGLPEFVGGVLKLESLKFFASPTAWFTCEVVLAALLLCPGKRIDRALLTLNGSSATALHDGARVTGGMTPPARQEDVAELGSASTSIDATHMQYGSDWSDRAAPLASGRSHPAGHIAAAQSSDTKSLRNAPLCVTTGAILTALLSGVWLLGFYDLPRRVSGLETGVMLAALGLIYVLVHAQSSLAKFYGTVALAFANIVAFAALCEVRIGDEQLGEPLTFAIAVGLLLTQWLVSYGLAARPELRVSQAFAMATKCCSFVFLMMLVPVQAFMHLVAAVGWHDMTPAGWCTSVALVAWLFDAARRQRSKLVATGAMFGFFSFSAAVVLSIAPTSWEWIPTLWVAQAALLVPLLRLVERKAQGQAAQRQADDEAASVSSWQPVAAVAAIFVPTILIITSLGAMVFFTAPALVAGALAPLVLFAWSGRAGRSRWLGQISDLRPLRVQVPLMLLNWRLFGAVVAVMLPEAEYLFQPNLLGSLALCLPVAFTAAASAFVWSLSLHRSGRVPVTVGELDLAAFHVDAMRYLAQSVLFVSVFLPDLDAMSIGLAATAFALLTATELFVACRRGHEVNVWKAEAFMAAAVAYFVRFGVVTLGRGWSMYVVLATAFVLHFTADLARDRRRIAVFAGPFRATSMVLPAVTVVLAVVRHLRFVEGFTFGPSSGFVPTFEAVSGSGLALTSWMGWNSLALFGAAMFYFREGLVLRPREQYLGTVMVRDHRYTVAAAAILNVALILLWRAGQFTDPQFYMIPIGVTMLCLVELLEREIPRGYRDPLRYAGALVILVSPTFHIVTGSWLHIFTLMVAAVFTILASIGFRTRALMYTGTAFLAADIVAMIARGSIDHPQLLWVAGAAFGAGILGLGAVCELKREQVQQRVRAVGAALAEWK